MQCELASFFLYCTSLEPEKLHPFRVVFCIQVISEGGNVLCWENSANLWQHVESESWTRGKCLMASKQDSVTVFEVTYMCCKESCWIGQTDIGGVNTRWFKYDRDKLWLVYTQSVPVIFEPPCIMRSRKVLVQCKAAGLWWTFEVLLCTKGKKYEI
jgi:hypothetical protein